MARKVEAQPGVDNTKHYERSTTPPVHVGENTFASRFLIMAVLKKPHSRLKQKQTGDCHYPDDGVVTASQMQGIRHGYTNSESGDYQSESQELEGRMYIDHL